jgi:hypothetical protein
MTRHTKKGVADAKYKVGMDADLMLAISKPPTVSTVMA